MENSNSRKALASLRADSINAFTHPIKPLPRTLAIPQAAGFHPPSKLPI
jgi:hypothetical protein